MRDSHEIRSCSAARSERFQDYSAALPVGLTDFPRPGASRVASKGFRRPAVSPADLCQVGSDSPCRELEGWWPED